MKYTNMCARKLKCIAEGCHLVCQFVTSLACNLFGVLFVQTKFSCHNAGVRVTEAAVAHRLVRVCTSAACVTCTRVLTKVYLWTHVHVLLVCRSEDPVFDLRSLN